MRGDVARLPNDQRLFSDLPSCHPVTSHAAHRNETTLRLEISWEMPRSVAAGVSSQLCGPFGLCKELLGGKAQSFKGEKWWEPSGMKTWRHEKPGNAWGKTWTSTTYTMLRLDMPLATVSKLVQTTTGHLHVNPFTTVIPPILAWHFTRKTLFRNWKPKQDTSQAWH